MRPLFPTILTLLASPALAENTGMIVACQQLGADYAWYLDHPDKDIDTTALNFADLFTSDGSWQVSNMELQMETHSGAEEIMARYKQGRDQFRFMHLITNHRVNPTSETTGTGTSYVEFYIHPIGADMTHDFGVTGVAEYRDTYEFKDGICRLTSREGVPRFISLENKIHDPIPE